MPIFLYRHPKTDEIREIVQSVHEEHIYIDEKGVKWDREFTVPTAAIDTKIDENDPQSFVKYTGTRKGKLDDLFNLSKELSEKREKKQGVDTVKEKMYEEYKNVRKKDHPEVKKKKLKKSLEKSNFTWED